MNSIFSDAENISAKIITKLMLKQFRYIYFVGAEPSKTHSSLIRITENHINCFLQPFVQDLRAYMETVGAR